MIYVVLIVWAIVTGSWVPLAFAVALLLFAASGK